ncbi:helix-turn-helix domain-containing protein [Mycobacterium xenopi]|uniref:helix-turn-helix domain-containing protein n=2 Tax=Mycobacterium xenopi TaxID=1789 RepID=UPI001FD5E784|nr:helix-turn-helix domain-containing protein [Mycobacterium xenopi]
MTVRIRLTYDHVMRTAAPALLPIFRSQNQGRLLAQLLLNPSREYTVTDLARVLGASKQAAQQEVERLVAAHVLRDRRQGRNRLISANPDHPAYMPLAQLALLTFGPHNILAEEFGAIEGVERVLIFGSWAARYTGQPGPPPNDIDVLVIGETSRMDVFDAADRAQKRIGVAVNPEQATTSQWANPSDWPLLKDIQQRPYVAVFPRTEAGPA